jgi:hypothetical protein
MFLCDTALAKWRNSIGQGNKTLQPSAVIPITKPDVLMPLLLNVPLNYLAGHTKSAVMPFLPRTTQSKRKVSISGNADRNSFYVLLGIVLKNTTKLSQLFNCEPHHQDMCGSGRC